MIFPIYSAILNLIMIFLLYTLGRKRFWVKRIQLIHIPQYHLVTTTVILDIFIISILIGNDYIPVESIINVLIWMFILGFTLYLSIKTWQKRNHNLVSSRNFYKIFKYIFTQLDTGANVFQVFKVMYLIADDMKLRKILLQFSVMLSQNNQLSEAVNYLKVHLKTNEGKIFCNIVMNIGQNSLTSNGLIHVDQMLFQKYLSSLRAETKRIERHYIMLIVVFTVEISVYLLMPLLAQMGISANQIFQ